MQTTKSKSSLTDGWHFVVKWVGSGDPTINDENCGLDKKAHNDLTDVDWARFCSANKDWVGTRNKGELELIAQVLLGGQFAGGWVPVLGGLRVARTVLVAAAAAKLKQGPAMKMGPLRFGSLATSVIVTRCA